MGLFGFGSKPRTQLESVANEFKKVTVTARLLNEARYYGKEEDKLQCAVFVEVMKFAAHFLPAKKMLNERNFDAVFAHTLFLSMVLAAYAAEYGKWKALKAIEFFASSSGFSSLSKYSNITDWDASTKEFWAEYQQDSQKNVTPVIEYMDIAVSRIAYAVKFGQFTMDSTLSVDVPRKVHDDVFGMLSHIKATADMIEKDLSMML